MVIDFHTHIFPQKIAKDTIEKLEQVGNTKAYTDGTLDGLMDSMRVGDIDCSVILPVVTRLSQFRSVNQYAREITPEKYLEGSRNVISFGGIHPDAENYKAQLKEIKDLGLKGIKLHSDYQKLYVDDIKMLRLVDYASELDLIITLHAGLDIGLPEIVHCTPDRVENLLDQLHPPKLILAHMGGYGYWDSVEERLIGREVYLDTSYSLGLMGDEQFLRMVKNHGAEKILFATDSPWGGQKKCLSHFKGLGMEAENMELILYQNAKGLLTL